jgi:hypothetical protein
MTFSQEPYQTAISKNEKISTYEMAYYQQRLRHNIFSKLVSTFAERAEKNGLSKAKLAILTGKDPAVINRLLSLPSNLTLDTFSDISLAMGCEPEISLEYFDDARRYNYSHPWMESFARKPLLEIVESTEGYIKYDDNHIGDDNTIVLEKVA